MEPLLWELMWWVFQTGGNMTEIDPWAMPHTAAVNPGSVGIPGSIYTPAPRIHPLERRLPRVVGGLGLLFVILSIAEIFYIDHAATLAEQLNSMILSNQFPTMAQSAQLQADDSAIGNVSWIVLAVCLAMLVALGLWQRSLAESLGSVGARTAVLRRAGYRYLRLAWALALLFTLFLQATTTSGNVNSYQDVLNHDHKYMVYCAVRAGLGALVVFWVGRLRRIADEGVDRLNGVYGAD